MLYSSTDWSNGGITVDLRIGLSDLAFSWFTMSRRSLLESRPPCMALVLNDILDWVLRPTKTGDLDSYGSSADSFVLNLC